MLDIHSLDIFMKNIAAKTVLLLKELAELKHDHVGHGIVLRAMIGSNFV